MLINQLPNKIYKQTIYESLPLSLLRSLFALVDFYLIIGITLRPKQDNKFIGF